MEIELGWPAKELWPNGGRGHPMAVYRATKAAKDEAFWATKIVKPLDWKHDGNKIAIHIIARRKTEHAVDAQNLIAGLKAQFDGIALALGVDDKHFHAPTVEWAEPVRGGRIVVTVG